MTRQAGFSLLEAMLALSLGLLVLLGGNRLFIAASQSWQAQEAAARMQEDARHALQRLAQSLRMAGMFGCLRHDAIVFDAPWLPMHSHSLCKSLAARTGACSV